MLHTEYLCSPLHVLYNPVVGLSRVTMIDGYFWSLVLVIKLTMITELQRKPSSSFRHEAKRFLLAVRTLANSHDIRLVKSYLERIVLHYQARISMANMGFKDLGVGHVQCDRAVSNGIQ
jgi:hypothetical protein